jgi:hypothetical protein
MKLDELRKALSNAKADMCRASAGMINISRSDKAALRRKLAKLEIRLSLANTQRNKAIEK